MVNIQRCNFKENIVKTGYQKALEKTTEWWNKNKATVIYCKYTCITFGCAIYLTLYKIL